MKFESDKKGLDEISASRLFIGIKNSVRVYLPTTKELSAHFQVETKCNERMLVSPSLFLPVAGQDGLRLSLSRAIVVICRIRFISKNSFTFY
jgi:hypothetical protein